MNNPEILAPVGNGEMLIAAVRSGADAIYLGGSDFNARRNAQNFNSEEMKSAVEYCRINGVKVYLTLNTIVADSEIPAALNTAKEAAKLGIDGVIIADLGLAARISAAIPSLALHASTQLSVHSPAALKFLKKAGFKRVVVSREMGKSALKEFCAAAHELDIEVEVFVHGALCMSVSGQCLLSAIIGGRSGNRGLCAGPCRLPFEGGGSKYALSLKDLSLLEYAAELKEIGVDSFKIEGRMKRAEYVAAAVFAFKNALQGKSTADISKMLQNIFSRSGFTAGYFEEKIGADMFGIRTRDDIAAAACAIPEIHNLYRNEKPRVPISLKAKILKGKPAFLELSDGTHTASVFGDIPALAKTKAAEKEGVLKNLSKLGSTPYFINKSELELDSGIFISSAALNELRRSACEKLNSLRAMPGGIDIISHSPKYSEKQSSACKKLYCRFESCAQFPNDFSGISLFSLPIDADLTEFSPPQNIIAAVELPRGIDNEAFILNRLSLFKQKGFTHAFCGTIAAKELAANAGFKVIADIGLNIFNSDAAAVWENEKISKIVLSPELKKEDILKIKTKLPLGIFAYGRLPVMLTKNCPVKGEKGCKDCQKDRFLIDRLGVTFPVACKNGYSYIYNSRPIWLADQKDEFGNIDFFYLYFTFEDKQAAEKVIKAYKNGEKCAEDFTRGLYYRGVQ